MAILEGLVALAFLIFIVVAWLQMRRGRWLAPGGSPRFDGP